MTAREEKVTGIQWATYIILCALGLVAAIALLWSHKATAGDTVLGVAVGLIAAGGSALLWAWATGVEQTRPRVFESAASVPFGDLLLATTDSLDVSGMTLTDRLSEFLKTQFPDQFRHVATTQDFTLRLLFCDPDNPYLKERAACEQVGLDGLKFDAWASVARTCLLAKRCGALLDEGAARCASFEVRMLTDQVMTCATFRAGGTIVVGPYLSYSVGRATMRIRFFQGNHPVQFRQFQSDFDGLWQAGSVWLLKADRANVKINRERLIGLGLPGDTYDFLGVPCVRGLLRRGSKEAEIFDTARKFLVGFFDQANRTATTA